MKYTKEAEYSKAILEMLITNQRLKRSISLQSVDEVQLLKKILRDNNVSIRVLSKLSDELLHRFKLDDELYKQRMRVKNNIEFLGKLKSMLKNECCDYTVTESLDDYPDLGNELDLLILEGKAKIIKILSNQFAGRIVKPAISDIISDKTNIEFRYGIRLEIHNQRLGAAGEETLYPKILMRNKKLETVNGYSFFVPCNEDKVLIAAEHRINRHFSIRICDIYNSLRFIKEKNFDWDYLWKTAEILHIKDSMKLYLDYIRHIESLILQQKKENSRHPIKIKNSHFRYPLLPTMLKVYVKKFWGLLASGNVVGTLRMCMIVPLLLLSLSKRLLGKS